MLPYLLDTRKFIICMEVFLNNLCKILFTLCSMNLLFCIDSTGVTNPYYCRSVFIVFAGDLHISLAKPLSSEDWLKQGDPKREAGSTRLKEMEILKLRVAPSSQ